MAEPTGREKQIIDERKKKIEELRSEGINPYAYKFEKKHWAQELQETYKDLGNEKILGDEVKTAGRLMIKRSLGKIAFGTLQDNTGRVQVLLQKGETPEETMNLFKKVDSGDFIGVTGNPTRTKTGELSILVKELKLLTKSIKPLPEKWHGMKDKEDQYRMRYLDLVMSPEKKQIFIKKQKIIDSIREFLGKQGYHEVQTPVLQPIYGGGNARPFESRLNALDMNVFMRISNEMYLKRLIVGGFEKVFEFSTDFRNEGIDRSHNPEFTLFEAMTAYTDYEDGMDLVEELTEHVVKKVTGGTKVTYQGSEIGFKAPWKRISVRDALNEYAGIDIEKVDNKELKKQLEKHKLEIQGVFDRGNAIMALVEEFCEPKFIQPTMLYDYPVETSPLAKKKKDDGRYVERFEQFVNGFEVGNNYSEITDADFLRKNWEHQEEMLSSGDEEAQRTDEDYLNALEVGMPPTCGIAISIDRMIMLLTDQSSIRDVILFPFMKPEETQDTKKKKTKKKQQ